GHKEERCKPRPDVINKTCLRCGILGHRVGECRVPVAGLQKKWIPIVAHTKVPNETELEVIPDGAQSNRGKGVDLASQEGEPQQWKMVLGRNASRPSLSSSQGVIPTSQKFAALHGLVSCEETQADDSTSIDHDWSVEHQGLE
ncbi:hypothetical protein Dimus_007390, partial [Dionaea muscipula]